MPQYGEHWERKIRTCFKRLDTDGDGLLTKKDFMVIAENVITSGKLIGERAEVIRKNYAEIWTTYYQPVSGEKGANEDAFLAGLKRRGKQDFCAVAQEQFSLFFDIVDTNQDGKIQHHEFTTYCNILGIQEKFAKKAFVGLDTNKDGVLSREEFVSAAKDFFTLEEPSHPCDMFYGALE